MKASEARARTVEALGSMDDIYTYIKKMADCGEVNCIFHEGELDDPRIEVLKVQGYKVSWDSACLWYDVQW